jgi:type IV secretion system protein VirB4
MLAHPAFREKLKEWLLAFGKKNCVVFMATQQLSHAVESGILDTILESTAVKIYLPNPDAAQPDTGLVYKRFGLNERQISIIATAIPKRQYYYEADSGQRLYELALGPLALAFAGATDKESIAQIQQLVEEHGDAWVDHWLSIKGLSLADYGVAA